MSNNPRQPRPADEQKRLAEALRLNLLKRKNLAKQKKTEEKPENSGEE